MRILAFKKLGQTVIIGTLVAFFAAGSAVFAQTTSAKPLSPVATASVGAARQSLNQFSAKIQTLAGRFEQKVLDGKGKVLDQSKGVVHLKAPRQFRWEIQQPAPQTIVADGDNVWVYDVELEQVSVRAQSIDEAQSPLAILLDLGTLDQEFKVSEGGKTGSTLWLHLRSKAKEPDFKLAELGFQSNALVEMRLTDQFNQRTVIRFSQWQRNPTLPAKTFQFTPPEGVDVVGEPARKPDIIKIPN